MELKAGSRLQDGKYEIIRTLGQGGFGITYLAEQTLVDRKVCIKEFFVREYCDREGTTSRVTLGTTSNAAMTQQYMSKFIKEAKTIAKLDHQNIVRIHDVFKENNTAYIVMEYIAGESLGEIVKAHGALTEAEAVGYIGKVGEALAFAHSNRVMHLDVKPSNIMLDREHDRPVLIDFGLSKQYSESGDQTSSTPVGLSQGYAPIEQYQAGGVKDFSPATDVYSLGATLYKLLTGMTPPSANAVFETGLPELPKTVSAATRRAVEEAMRPRRKDRPQSVGAFLSLLDGGANAAPHPQLETEAEETVLADHSNAGHSPASPVVPQAKKEKSQKKRNPLILAVLLAVVAVGVIAFFLLRNNSGGLQFDEGPVDMGLSVKWASCNIGANRPEEYGDYYTYGGTRTKSAYSSENYLPYRENKVKQMTEDGEVLSLQNDIAHVSLGGDWRLPTGDEWEELIKCCDARIVKVHGVRGIEMKSKVNGNRIFLPAAGYRQDTYLSSEGRSGWYRTATLTEGARSKTAIFDESIKLSTSSAHQGFSVRPVYGSKGEPAEKVQSQKKTSENKTKEITKRNAVQAKTISVEAVDMGLSVKWGTCNIGAKKPEDYGDYYAWGETKTKSTYNWSTYTLCQGSDTTMTKYCTQSKYGTVDNKKTLYRADDVASKKLGGKWRMPTDAEWTELRNTSNCTWTRTEENGVNGYRVTSKKTGNSIFLPAAGYRYGDGLDDAGSYGYYWSSSLSTDYPSRAWRVYFGSGSVNRGGSYRYYGQSVRPVSE